MRLFTISDYDSIDPKDELKTKRLLKAKANITISGFAAISCYIFILLCIALGL